MCISQDTARSGIDRLACDLEHFQLEIEYIRDDRKRYLKAIKSALKKVGKKDSTEKRVRSRQRMVEVQNRTTKIKERSKEKSVRRSE